MVPGWVRPFLEVCREVEELRVALKVIRKCPRG